MKNVEESPQWSVLPSLIDTDRYPLDKPGSAQWRRLATETRRSMRETNCAQLHGFLKADAIAAMVAEIGAKEEQFDEVSNACNAYFSPDDPSLPETHPIRMLQRENGRSLCRDRMDEDGPMPALFASDELLGFVCEVIGRQVLYRHADPMTSILVNVARDGEGTIWHFDSNEVTITILLQKPEAGGEFEYIPNLRTEDEPNYDAVAAAIRGDRSGVTTARAGAGSLQIFAGRYSLHHVTKTIGATERYILVLAYADKPGLQTSKWSMIESFGRCHALHDEAAGRSSLSADALR